MTFGGFRTMWVLVLFDLPTDTKEDRHNYRKFRQGLLEDGAGMMQFSAYIRHCPSEENAAVHRKRVRAMVPPKGEVRILMLTDKQFERMEIFYGKLGKAPEQPPEQYTIF